MENLPVYIGITFILTTLYTAALLFRASRYSSPVMLAVGAWLALQAALGIAGFYKTSSGLPPRFALLLIPPLIVVLIIFITKKGKILTGGFDVKALVLMHIARVPVEFTLLWLYQHHAIPQLMTFEGRNFDIFCGVTAPFIYYWGYVKMSLGKVILLAWNIVCLLLLFNIIVSAVLSAPFAFQMLAFDQPNVALFYFPFVWLPSFVVPAVLMAHLVALKRLLETDGSRQPPKSPLFNLK